MTDIQFAWAAVIIVTFTVAVIIIGHLLYGDQA